MRLLTIGAGPVVREALYAGHHVTVLTDDHRTVAVCHDNLDVIEGDLRNGLLRPGALGGHDAVVLVADSYETARSVVREMESGTVDRLICISDIGSSGPSADLPWSRRLAGVPVSERQRLERMLRRSRLDWTLIQLPDLRHGPLTGRVRISSWDSKDHWFTFADGLTFAGAARLALTQLSPALDELAA